MANPLSDEAEIYDRIKKKKIKIDSDIWQLIDHYVGNDVYAIQMNAGSHVMGDNPDPIPAEDGKKILQSCERIRSFFVKLKEATRHKA